MSFPNYPEKHKFESLLTADELVAYRERLGRMPKVRPEGVLFCLERGLPHRMRWRIPVERAGAMNADVYAIKKAKGKYLLSQVEEYSQVLMLRKNLRRGPRWCRYGLVSFMKARLL